MIFEFELFSDLHLERYSESYLPTLYRSFSKKKSNYLFLAGDICHSTHPNFLRFFQYCSQQWSQVFYILGNHECYSQSFQSIEKIHTLYKNLLKPYTNIKLLCDESYFLEKERIMIYGSTLWTDPNLDIHIENWHNGRQLNKKHIHDMALLQKQRLLSFLTHSLKETYKIIILTHFPTSSYKTVHPRYSQMRIHYFTWNLIHEIPRNDNILGFLSGHTHYSIDQIQNNYRYISNAIGYNYEETQGDVKKKFRMEYE